MCLPVFQALLRDNYRVRVDAVVALSVVVTRNLSGVAQFLGAGEFDWAGCVGCCGNVGKCCGGIDNEVVYRNRACS